MYRISELAKQVGLSRSTLLYYEKLGLITSKRQANGYRAYSDHDLQQLKLLQQLQAGGLTLRECQACLQKRINRQSLLERLHTLDKEIAAKQQSRELLASILGLSSMRGWHQQLEHQAPGAHMTWLLKQGFSEKQALRLKWLSKDMNEHEQYMADFEKIFDGLERLGPGSAEDSLTALKVLPHPPEKILEIGCGRGATTVLLAEHTQGVITALDNDEYSLSCLQEIVMNKALQSQVKPICASMTELPFPEAEFDVIWAEGCAYIMGFENALKYWRAFIKPFGLLVVSDLVKCTELSDEASAFWKDNYPDLQNVEARLSSIGTSGYKTLHHFQLSSQAWDNYLKPLHAKVGDLSKQQFSSRAFNDTLQELNIHSKHLGEYGYEMFILQKL